MSGAGTQYGGSPTLRYRNHLTSNGTWVGHPDYAGQFLMVDPTKQASAAFFSAPEAEYGECGSWTDARRIPRDDVGFLTTPLSTATDTR